MRAPWLKILDYVPDAEIVHYAAADALVTSRHRHVAASVAGHDVALSLPRTAADWCLPASRLARRALRLDKCNVVPVGTSGDLVAVRGGAVYHYRAAAAELRATLSLANCRVVLHGSIAQPSDTSLYLVEYGRNAEMRDVPVHASRDGGLSWQCATRLPAGKVRHGHGCYWDPFERKIWIPTGDFAGQCFLIVADEEFRELEWIGDGTQTYRAVAPLFAPDAVHWIMDSPLEPSCHVRLDRKTRTVARGRTFPGPVWYTKSLSDGWRLAATAVEPGAGVSTTSANVYATRDFDEWHEVARFEHDRLPLGIFKFAVLAFADGAQSSDSFYLFGEAVRGLDGRAARCCLLERTA